MSSDLTAKLHLQVLKGQKFSFLSRLVPILNNETFYFEVELGNEQFKSKSVTRCENPEWNQDHTFHVQHPFGTLNISFFDGAEFLGKVSIPLVDLSDQEPHQKLYLLRKRQESDENVKGEIILHLHYKYLEVWDCLYKCFQAIKEKAYSQSIRLLDDAISRFPNNYYELYAYRSEAHLNLQNFKASLEDAKKVNELNPNTSEGYYRLGMVFYALDEYDQAEQCFRTGLKYDTFDERCTKAIDEIKKNTIKQQVRKLIAKGRQEFLKEEFDLAIDYFNDAIEKNPQNGTYYVYRAIAYMSAKKYEEARKDAMLVVQYDPNWPKTNPIKQGYLSKEGKVNVMMRKRWFILKEYFLYYYETSKDLIPKGVILFALGNFDLQKNKKTLMRIVTQKRTYELKSESEKERDEWLNVFEVLLNKKTYELPQSDIKEDRVILEAAVETISLFEGIAQLPDTLSNTVKTTVTAPMKLATSVAGKIQSKFTSLSLDHIEEQGILFKVGEFHKSWKKRYCVLQDQFLHYFDPKDEKLIVEKKTVTPKGTIPLREATVVPAQDKVHKEFAFEVVTSGRTYVLSAMSEQDMLRWTNSILKASRVINDDGIERETVDQEPISPNITLTSSTSSASRLSSEASSLVVPGETTEPSSSPSYEKTSEAFKQLKPSTEITGSPKRPGWEAPVDTVKLDHLSAPSLPRSSSYMSDEDDNLFGNVASQANENFGGRIGSNQISTSESRYFAKFGLNPPSEKPSIEQRYDREDMDNSFPIGREEEEPLIRKQQPPNSTTCCSCVLL